MQVGVLVAKELELEGVAAAVAAVADVHRLVRVLDEMDHVPQGHPPARLRGAGIGQDRRNSSNRDTTQLSWQSRGE